MSDSVRCPERTLGVLGGMGPAAAAEFLRLLARDAPAGKDQEHPRLLMLSEPSIPDRSDGIMGLGKDPSPLLRRSLECLVEWGAELLAVPCNTAHYFIDQFRAELGAPLVHIVEVTVEEARRRSPEGAWLLATSGTLLSGIYPSCAERFGYVLHQPSEAQQAKVQESLRFVKAGDRAGAGQVLREVVEELWGERDLTVITACTELPLAYAASGLPQAREVSSLQALSDACLRALYEERG
ncbi:MAG: aspartate/glutamate racemase family protein [Fretibacterium sp.]|nr:aspartate/glutamate racemase family protein [Fretibacterium sp.]